MHTGWMVLLILVSALSSAAAQQPGMAPGSRIRVTHSCRVDDGLPHCYSRPSELLWRHTGTLVGVRSDTLVFQIAERQADVHIPLASLERLETSHGQKSRWATGAGIGLLGGALAGAVIGGAIGASSDPDYAGLHTVAGIILGAPVGFVIGAIAGSYFKTDRWVAVPIPTMAPGDTHSGGKAYGLSIRLSF